MKKNTDFLKLVQNRQTTFDFTDKKIPLAMMQKILEAGQWSPSSHNDQNWHFITIQKTSTVKQILNECAYGRFYTEPALLIAIVLEPIYEKKPALLRGKLRELADTHQYLNIGFTASQMILEAENLGLGNCILSITGENANQILAVPNTKKIPLILGFGFQKKGTAKSAHERKPLTQIVSNEKYNSKK